MNFKTVYTNDVDTLAFLNKDEYPLYFSKKYLDFEKQNGNESVLFYAEDNTIIPCRIYTKFIFKFLKPYCPPYKNGKRLSIEDENKFLNEWVKYLKKNKSISSHHSKLYDGCFFILSRQFCA